MVFDSEKHSGKRSPLRWDCFSQHPHSHRVTPPGRARSTFYNQAFTSTIARGLSLVAIVVSGLTFAFGEGGSKRVLAGVLFGVGMAIAAVNFLAGSFREASGKKNLLTGAWNGKRQASESSL
jgi:hypothetical protein